MRLSGSRPVFIITHEFFPKRGGIATFTEEIARATAAAGHSVEVWAQRATPSQEKAWPFTVRRMPLAGSHNIWCRFKIAIWLINERRRLRNAIVYLPEPGPMLAFMALLPVRAFLPRRLVMTFHGSEILRFHADPATRRLTQRLIRHAYRISTLTRYTQKLLCEKFPEASQKTVITEGALRSDLIVDQDKATPRSKEKTIILTVGRLHPRKGQLLALRALQALPAETLAQVEYWMAGSTSKSHYEQTLRSAAGKPGLTVRFLGNLSDDELNRVYTRADIFALTSIDHGHSVEGFGLVYLEASAHGLPVIAHRVGGVSEAVIEGKTGILVDPDKPAALTEAFRSLIEDPLLRERMGQTGRDWARRNTWATAVERLFEASDIDTTKAA